LNYYDKYKVNVPDGTSGEWKVDHFTIDDNTPGTVIDALHGRPIPNGTYTRLTCGKTVVMSDTEAEVRDHSEFIRKAYGRCLINGLGIGVVLKAITEKPEVTHVDVVELSDDVIKLVWPVYDGWEKVTLHHADAYTIQWPKGTVWNCAWHDIWPTICTDNMPEIRKLKSKYAQKVGWQAAWVEDEVRRMHRRDLAEERNRKFWLHAADRLRMQERIKEGLKEVTN
jgi:hypothetical protein